MSGLRLALRQEGTNWKAYVALKETMQGALFLGSINIQAAAHPEIKAAFMALMQLTMEQMVKHVTGADVLGWSDAKVAPAHEKAGRA